MSRKNTSPTPLEITSQGKASDVVLKPRNGRTSIHTPLFERLATLKKNECIVVRIPDGQTFGHLSNRLTTSLKSNKSAPLAPAGCYFSKRQTEDGQLAILVLPIEGKRGKKSAK